MTTVESSLQVVAMWAAVNLIVGLGSELPIDVYRGTGKQREQLRVPTYLQDPGGDGYGIEDWIAQYLTSLLLRGNSNGKVVGRDPSGGFPTQVSLYHPDTVAGWYDQYGRPQWKVMGRTIEPPDMWHKRVHPISGQLMGLSPVSYLASTIGLQLTSQRFGLQWFRDGGHPSGMLVNDEVELDGPKIRKAKELFMAAVFGSREPLVMGKGWTYKTIQIAPDESQFLETQGFSAAECARIFGPGVPEVLGYETGSSLTYSTLEGRSQHLLVFAVGKWLRRVERALTEMLPRGQYVKLNRAALLQTTTLERFRVHEIALRNRIRVPNEVRDDEDWAPVPWGNEPNPITGAGQPPADGHAHDDDPPGTNPPGKEGI
ncbi:phage portal protein [Micromonospora sp. CPCC 205371]|nr:phage portal protein [Micromonospora sp. CPCC 205371]